MDNIAVLIPCYNEGLTIYKVVSDFKLELPEAAIYVYDNNSSDNTSEEALRAGAVVVNEYRQGKGNVVRSMFRNIDAEVYLMVDGDDTYSAATARQMVELIKTKKADMVVGDRLSGTYHTENKRKFHSFGNNLVKALINFLFKGKVNDMLTGYRAFSYEFVKSFPILSSGFQIETEMSIFALDHKFNIAEIVTDYQDRPEGSVSKLNTITDGYRVIRMILMLFKNYRPYIFFGILSALFFVLGSVGLFPVLLDYFKTGLVRRFPTLIASTFVYIFSGIFLTCGLILETLRKQHLQDFELYLNQLKYFKS